MTTAEKLHCVNCKYEVVTRLTGKGGRRCLDCDSPLKPGWPSDGDSSVVSAEADRLVGEARDLLARASQLDFGDEYCDSESMLVLNNVLNDIDLIQFECEEEE